ncbi:MAG: UDP-N-acetylmuramoyl-L-alanyl-D-glutamate--2,6-diaminopimelate ligase [Candidatus Krumholzibacteria bacterium]|nr:UDP-N-acetylmuramoyl-L-alanyl-D-glutamate--2,6-diaminopimelate ligase [Candidatus Krumholzibacteria bacterium]
MGARRKKIDETFRLARLMDALDKVGANNMRDLDVRGLKSDSRAVEPGDVFVALRGVTFDGHGHVREAIERGAVACVTEHRVETGDVPNVVVTDTAKALAVLASHIAEDPARDLRLVGVTGTNGKTSTAHLLRAICDKSSWGKMGIIGTVGHGVGTELEEGAHTTPEPITLHRLLKKIKKQSCVGVVMEVSSHAVRQQRVWGLDFEIGMLTNITRDHLDYHPTFEDYVDAKREFCYSLIAAGRRKEAGTLIYSVDNEQSKDIGERFPGKKISTSSRVKADVFAAGVRATREGTRFELHFASGRISVNLQLLGTFSAANAVMAAAGAHQLGIDHEAIKQGLESVSRVRGRFEALGGGTKPLVIVDYSHTPDSLERTLKFCRVLTPGRLITVFGCGGDRDKGKRPLMGEIAEKYSDICYVTSDNPRSEDPGRIIEEILSGMDPHGEQLHVEVDRRKAIHEAIEQSAKGDLVAICGKGHEDYQIIGARRIHFDDREQAERALQKWDMS